MSESTVATFNAGASMLGYLYQVRVALLWAIRQSRVGDFSVSVETLDDVSFESNGDPIAVLQTKHSVHSTSGLSDLSPDLWKTLRIWMVGRRSGEVPIVAAKFLISTSVTSAGTACAALVPASESRDVEAASIRLKQAAATSTNAELKDAFEAFLALDETERRQLLNSIYVVAGQPDADAIQSQLQAGLYHVSLHHQALSMQMIEGWWFKRVIHELVHGGAGIPRAEIDAQISEVQESLKRDALPIDEEIDALMVPLNNFRSSPIARSIARSKSSVPGRAASATRSRATCRRFGSVLPGCATTCCSMLICSNTTSA